MQVSTNEITTKIHNDFSKTYKAFGDLVNSGEIWDMCMNAIGDTKLMNNIIFCNDIHHIPPVNTFLKVCGANEMRDLAELEKRSIGAFWGFVFKCRAACKNEPVKKKEVLRY